jgi:hypothetical protein
MSVAREREREGGGGEKRRGKWEKQGKKEICDATNPTSDVDGAGAVVLAIPGPSLRTRSRAESQPC